MKTIFNILICLVSAAPSRRNRLYCRLLMTKKPEINPYLLHVTIKGTTKGTTTDFDGLYQIENIEPGTYTVVFSFVGYETLEVPNVKVKQTK